ncbi:MAG: DUF1641 domain-containing protein [Ignavibacteriales bacterium]|nr:DUF1641 domain-containing protein [Ignavibacteriales bacterium]
MDTTYLQEQIDGINRKLDVILEEIELQQRHRREMDDLKDDLMRVGKDVYQSAVVELEEVHDYIQTGDILYLFKKLLRNIKNLTAMFETLENTRDFVQDFTPISRELFIDFMNKLDEFDRKGYFAFIKELNKVGDKVVTSFSVEDVKNLGDNIVTILNTVKNLTQPDMLHVINNALAVYKKLDIEIEKDVSLISLLKELNTPEMKRGLAFAIKFLKSVAEQQTTNRITAVTAVQTN